MRRRDTLRVRQISWEEQNDHYDPDKAGDGGGYSWPLIKWEITFKGKRFLLEFNDSSCGWFGDRWTIRLFDEYGNTIQYHSYDDVSRGDDYYKERIVLEYPALEEVILDTVSNRY